MDFKRRDIIKTAALSVAGTTSALVSLSLNNKKVAAQESDDSCPESTNVTLQLLSSGQDEKQPKVLNLTLTKVGTVPELASNFSIVDSLVEVDPELVATCSCQCGGNGGAGAGS